MRRTLLILVLVVTACSGASGDPEPPDDLLARSASVMGELDSAAYVMERTGAPVTIQGLEFSGADGVYGAPDRASAVLDVVVSGITVRLATVSVGDRTWLTNPVTGAWDELDPGTGFNPARVFDPRIGWQRLLSQDLTDVVVEGREGDVWRVSAVAAGDRVEVLTAGLAGGEGVPISMEIDADSSHLRSVRFATESDAGTSEWLIELDEFDEPVTIEPPTP